MEQQNPGASGRHIEFFSPGTSARVEQCLKPNRRYFVGSGIQNAIVLKQEGVEPRHASLIASAARVRVGPVENKPLTLNGQLVVEETDLNDGDWLVLGSALFHIRLSKDSGPSVSSTSAWPVNRAQAVLPLYPSQTISIGRTADCDVVIESPIVSSRHACLSWKAGRWSLSDMGSTNGTYVNGRRITTPVTLEPEDHVAIAVFRFIFTGDELKPLDATGRIRIEVHDLKKDVRDRSSDGMKHLLEHIDLVIEAGEFVGIFGTSGSGKSTLLDALNGRRPPTDGNILYNGSELYGSFDLFRASIGYVPQQDIVHRKISIKHALKYTARLRLPPDTSESEIETYIAKVLDQVGLREKADLPVDTPVPLSGGQLKRVSLAVELVANPNLLFLDEVTSGLDAGTDKKMMHLFAELAATGKTVICVTHTLESIDACDLVALMHQGRLVYFGPPGQAPEYFAIGRLSDVYELLESSKPGLWADRFETSKMYQQYILGRFSKQTDLSAAANTTRNESGKSKQSWLNWRQTNTLMQRYCELIFSDRRNLAIMLLQAPLIAAVIGGVFRIEGLAHEQAMAESRIAFMLVLSAIWFGCLNSARELVKELPIYLRERSVNLGIASYLISKLIPLAVLCAIQCATLLGVVLMLVPLSGSFLPQLGALFLAGMASTAMGLTVSALVDSNDKAVAIVPILLIPQVILSNAVVPLENAGESFAKATMISFWAFDALKATLGKSTLSLTDQVGDAIVPVIGGYTYDLGVVVCFFVGFLACATLGLRLKDRKK